MVTSESDYIDSATFGSADDPLNWSDIKKHTILLSVAFAAFAGDFGSRGGIPAVAGQEVEWQRLPFYYARQQRERDYVWCLGASLDALDQLLGTNARASFGVLVMGVYNSRELCQTNY